MLGIKKQFIKSMIKLEIVGNTPGKLQVYVAQIKKVEDEYKQYEYYAENAMRLLKGVESLDVDYQKGVATIKYDPNIADVQKIYRWLQAIIDIGINYYDELKSMWEGPGDETKKVEAIWQKMPINKSTVGILNTQYPIYQEKLYFNQDAKKMEMVFETIKTLRNLRAEFNIPLGSKIDIIIDKNEELYSQIIPYLERLAKVNSVKFMTDSNIPKSAYCTVGDTKITVPLEDLIDLNQEIARQQKKIDKLQLELNSIEGRLKNSKFIDSAPQEVVQKTKDRKDELLKEIELINNTIKKLS